jgi:hypothetical protein
MGMMTERKPPGVSFETWVERQIARAQAEGQFDDLPGAGKPLPRRSEDESVHEWVVEKARKENIDLFGMLPPGLALRKEREDLPQRIAVLPSEAAVRALIEDFNARVQAQWRRPQLRADVVPGMADEDELVAGWRLDRPPPPPPLPSADEPAPRARWWRLRAHRRQVG